MDLVSRFISKHLSVAKENNTLPKELFSEYSIKQGLRNSNGTGVLVGMTAVGSVVGYEISDGVKIPTEGRLYYRGYDVASLVDGFEKDRRFGYEETAYLLIFGTLPNEDELRDFNEILASYRELPHNFVESMILKIPSKDIMNKLQRSILVLYSHEDDPDNIELAHLIKQSIMLIARFPTIISYGYMAKAHYFDNKSLFIHQPCPELSTAENILHLIRQDNHYTRTEVETLDTLLVIHAEHGGGNNSAFATHVVSSSGTDTYSAIATAVGALKGPKHGGASIRVKEMMDDLYRVVGDNATKEDVRKYLEDVVAKKAFNGEGLIYGMGHAVYTKSDPRAEMLKVKAEQLAIEKDAMGKLDLYFMVEEQTKAIFNELKPGKFICANVDLYSGFVYEMLGIPAELYTPLFATARVSGWCAHRIEQILTDKKILRPAYKNVSHSANYVELSNR